MEFILAPASVWLPAVFTLVCVVGFLQARREGLERRARLFAIGVIVGVLLTIWGWASFPSA